MRHGRQTITGPPPALQRRPPLDCWPGTPRASQAPPEPPSGRVTESAFARLPRSACSLVAYELELGNGARYDGSLLVGSIHSPANKTHIPMARCIPILLHRSVKCRDAACATTPRNRYTPLSPRLYGLFPAKATLKWGRADNLFDGDLCHARTWHFVGDGCRRGPSSPCCGSSNCLSSPLPTPARTD